MPETQGNTQPLCFLQTIAHGGVPKHFSESRRTFLLLSSKSVCLHTDCQSEHELYAPGSGNDQGFGPVIPEIPVEALQAP